MEPTCQPVPGGARDADCEFAAILAAHEAPLLRYVARLVNDREAARDVVQDTFIKLFRAWRPGTRPSVNLRAWLYRVAHHAAVDVVRKERRRRAWRERAAREQRETPPGRPRPEGDRAALVLEQVSRLEPAERQVLVLRLEEGLSYREIGIVTGRTEGNVGCLLHHAVTKLAARLRAAGASRGGGAP